MAGQDKAHYGRAHEIAVALGLKIVDQESTVAQKTRNTQHAQAA